MGGSTQTRTTQGTTTQATSGSTAQTGERNPWAAAIPGLETILGNITKYGGDSSLFAPTQSGDTQAGMDMMRRLATNPLAQEGVWGNLSNQAQRSLGVGNNSLMTTASGGMLNGNPYLDQTLANSRSDIIDDVSGRFSAAGRYGSNASMGRALGDALTRGDTNVRYQNYDAERQRQLGAANSLMGFGQNAGNYAQGVDNSRAMQGNWLTQIGGMQDQYDMARRQAPLQGTEWMARLGVPIAGLGGTSSGTAEQTGTMAGTNNGTERTHTPANIPGMVMGGVGMGLGMLGGGGLGGLGGLLGGQSTGGAWRNPDTGLPYNPSTGGYGSWPGQFQMTGGAQRSDGILYNPGYM